MLLLVLGASYVDVNSILIASKIAYSPTKLPRAMSMFGNINAKVPNTHTTSSHYCYIIVYEHPHLLNQSELYFRKLPIAFVLYLI